MAVSPQLYCKYKGVEESWQMRKLKNGLTTVISRVLARMALNISVADDPLSIKNSDTKRYSRQQLSNNANWRLLNSCSYENYNGGGSGCDWEILVQLGGGV